MTTCLLDHCLKMLLSHCDYLGLARTSSIPCPLSLVPFPVACGLCLCLCLCPQRRTNAASPKPCSKSCTRLRKVTCPNLQSSSLQPRTLFRLVRRHSFWVISGSSLFFRPVPVKSTVQYLCIRTIWCHFNQIQSGP